MCIVYWPTRACTTGASHSRHPNNPSNQHVWPICFINRGTGGYASLTREAGLGGDAPGDEILAVLGDGGLCGEGNLPCVQHDVIPQYAFLGEALPKRAPAKEHLEVHNRGRPDIYLRSIRPGLLMIKIKVSDHPCLDIGIQFQDGCTDILRLGVQHAEDEHCEVQTFVLSENDLKNAAGVKAVTIIPSFSSFKQPNRCNDAFNLAIGL